MAPKTSYGFDEISTKLLKTIKVTLIKSITMIINQMLNMRIFPDKPKIVKVIPIHKMKMKHYSQIIGQIHIWKLIFKQLYQFFKEKKMFYNGQYGFWTEHSNKFASLELIDRVVVEIDKKHTPINICLNLCKAFDTLDNTILLEKLKHYGIARVAYKLMESYITKENSMLK